MSEKKTDAPHARAADPEGMNDARSDRANSALEAFQAPPFPRTDSAVPDLLCDLMHWCDRNPNEEFDVALTRARAYYVEETETGG